MAYERKNTTETYFAGFGYSVPPCGDDKMPLAQLRSVIEKAEADIKRAGGHSIQVAEIDASYMELEFLRPETDIEYARRIRRERRERASRANFNQRQRQRDIEAMKAEAKRLGFTVEKKS